MTIEIRKNSTYWYAVFGNRWLSQSPKSEDKCIENAIDAIKQSGISGVNVKVFRVSLMAKCKPVLLKTVEV